MRNDISIKYTHKYGFGMVWFWTNYNVNG